MSNIEVKVLDKEKWEQYLDAAFGADGKVPRGPIRLHHSAEEYETYTSDSHNDSICYLKGSMKPGLRRCKDGKYYRMQSGIWVTRKLKLPDGREEQVYRVKIAEIRNDFYTNQRIVPTTKDCFISFREDYLRAFKDLTNG